MVNSQVSGILFQEHNKLLCWYHDSQPCNKSDNIATWTCKTSLDNNMCNVIQEMCVPVCVHACVCVIIWLSSVTHPDSVTGLNTSEHDIHAFDTPAERYQKLRRVCRFLMYISFADWLIKIDPVWHVCVRACVRAWMRACVHIFHAECQHLQPAYFGATCQIPSMKTNTVQMLWSHLKDCNW